MAFTVRRIDVPASATQVQKGSGTVTVRNVGADATAANDDLYIAGSQAALGVAGERGVLKQGESIEVGLRTRKDELWVQAAVSAAAPVPVEVYTV